MFNRFAVFTTMLCAAVLSSAPNLKAQRSGVKNIVLVHGAWADGSGWRGVYDILVRMASQPPSAQLSRITLCCLRNMCGCIPCGGGAIRRSRAKLNTSRPTIARWKARFEKDGMAGLETQHRGSKPRTVTPAVQAKVLRKTTKPPVDGSTHWSCRRLAAALGLGKSTVQRIWSQARG